MHPLDQCTNPQEIMAMKRNGMVLLLAILQTTDAFVVTTTTTPARSRAAVVAASAVGNSNALRTGSAGARGTATRISATTGFFESLFSGLKV